ncbi:hypothetical protein, partial [Methanofollis fontis]
ERLKVEVTGESGDAFTFRAETPGFSYFAITALPEKAPVVAENMTPSATLTPAEPVETAETLPPATQKSPLVFAPVAALGALLLIRRR